VRVDSANLQCRTRVRVYSVLRAGWRLASVQLSPNEVEGPDRRLVYQRRGHPAFDRWVTDPKARKRGARRAAKKVNRRGMTAKVDFLDKKMRLRKSSQASQQEGRGVKKSQTAWIR
jgi:hypothetical protein